ncbi:MerR family transcriptional regulator [Cellvibrio sp. pealriver]|uniref:MerR family transcriptional regulator n=1 Tax=Cellvibrio sp. pealriver TaxID=1622269 RepID=UPI00069F2F1C|nr:MerR family transcriptional regulator [Cellvibrio sp. pealriver]
MNISQASEACGLPGKTIRYYEEIGLVVPKRQEGNDYRFYSGYEIAQLRLLQQGRIAGFTLAECRELLALYNNPSAYSSEHANQLVNQKVLHIDQQLAALQVLRATLLTIGQTGESKGVISEAQKDTAQQLTSSGLGMAFRLVDESRGAS